MPEWKEEILRRLESLKLPAARETEIAEEISQHLEDRYRELLAMGKAPAEAQRLAFAEINEGDLLARNLRALEKAATRDDAPLGGGNRELWGGLAQDVRYGLRMLAKSPGFTAVAILTLALGIGANTSIFSLIDGILMRSLPVRDAQSLVVLKWSAHKNPEAHNANIYGDCGNETFGGPSGSSSCSFPEPFFRDISEQSGIFSSVAAFANEGPLNISGNGMASVLTAEAISGQCFSTLGVRPALGRLIVSADDSTSAPPVVVLNYGYWKSRFGASPSVVGRSIRLNNVPFTIIGVAEPRFDSLSPGHIRDVWVPLSVLPQLHPTPEQKTRADDIYTWWLVIVGRLRPGVTIGQAQAAASVIFRNEMLHGVKALSKPEDNPQVAALPAQAGLAGNASGFSRELYVLMMAVGIVLLIACANVAGLLLSRATARQKEIAVRLTLGAGRKRVVRQLLTESVMLSVIGGVVGSLFAVWGSHAIIGLMAAGSDEPLGFSPGIDGRVLMFTFAASVLTGVIFGAAPALRSLRVDLTPALKEGAGGSAAEGGTGRWFGFFSVGNGLVIAQVALAVVALVGAGLLVRTLQNVKSVDPGFDTRNVLTFGLDPTLIGYKTAQADELYRNLQERLAAMQQVDSVSYSRVPLLGRDYSMSDFSMPGTVKGESADAGTLEVGADFFSTMHMRLLAGRGFDAAALAQAEVVRERAETQRAVQKPGGSGAAVNPKAAARSRAPDKAAGQANEAALPVVINQRFVEKYYAKSNPLGQHFGQREANAKTGASADPGYVIVGVVSDAKYQDLQSDIDPTVYMPSSGGDVTFEVRSAMSPGTLTALVRRVVSQMDSNLPVIAMHTETQLIEQLVSDQNMIAQVSGFFGVLALALACIGLYGLLAYEVSRRTREIGVRMALGARQVDVLRLVVGRGILLAVAGAAVGIGIALGVTRYLASLLYGVHPDDPVTMVGVAVLLVLVALAACYIPARRATQVDPIVALRYE
ncbi:MAG TPA: ABC transporter permease [Candidatus Sulfotelmatobacter sp.]|nr:ABC transporter permease [Candidatus Sulfotelmatobacter sp.]